MPSIVTKRNDLVEAPFDAKFVLENAFPVLPVDKDASKLWFAKTQVAGAGTRTKGQTKNMALAELGSIDYTCVLHYEDKLIATQDEGEIDEIALVSDAKVNISAGIETARAAALAALSAEGVKGYVDEEIAKARRSIVSKAVVGKTALICNEATFQMLWEDSDISARAAKFNVAYSPDLPGGGDAQLLARSMGFDMCLVAADEYAASMGTTVFVAKVPATTNHPQTGKQLARTLVKTNGTSLWTVNQYADGLNGGDRLAVESYCVPKILNTDLVIALDIDAEPESSSSES